MHARRNLLFAMVLFVNLGWHAAASAQAAATYPDKPIRIVVPFPPGSGTDVLARLLGQELGEAWSQPVIVDNRPGASTIVGTELVAKSPPDGYTLVMASNNHAINPALFKKLPFDPIKDFVAVGQVAVLPFILVVNPALPVKSLQELTALARAKPGQLTYASTGNGTPPHVAGELLKRVANIDIVHIPYKGSAAAMNDVIGGQVPMMFVNVPSSIGLIRAGKLRALAVGTGKRISAAPELPTVAELGYPGFDVSLWAGLLAPAGTPADIVNKLNREILRILELPDTKAKFLLQGAEPVGTSPAQFAALIADEVTRLGKIAKDINLRVD